MFTPNAHSAPDQVMEDLFQVRAAVPGLFPPDECDKYVSVKCDNGERFGLAWRMARYYSVLLGEQLEAERRLQCSVPAFNRLEKHLEFTKVEVGGPMARLDIEVCAHASGSSVCMHHVPYRSAHLN